ncbi:MAG TPA: hypothetical protein VFQ21_09420 [Gemmatimonadota bacterium]|nr:hypothetical protein [Gemmatimonadota bacterium]
MTNRQLLQRVVAASCLAALVAACNDSGTLGPPTDPDYDPMLDPADFGGPIDNPYFALVPGTTRHYEGETEDGLESVDETVTNEVRSILGVEATVVHVLEYLDGELSEETFDWYAQDDEGNVWYLGEDSREIENGEIVSTDGSWEAGVDGAQPGIIMQAAPQVGQRYYQEFYLGEAEDEAIVQSLNASVDVPFGEFAGCLQTEDFTRLEPDEREHKYYCPGVGLVLEESEDERIELVSVDAP